VDAKHRKNLEWPNLICCSHSFILNAGNKESIVFTICMSKSEVKFSQVKLDHSNCVTELSCLLQRSGATLLVSTEDLQVLNRTAGRHDDGKLPNYTDPGVTNGSGHGR
jgi:hypothetical protein